MALYLSAVQGGDVVAWSFSELITPTALPFAGRPTYFVFLAYSEVEPYFEFTIDVKVRYWIKISII